MRGRIKPHLLGVVSKGLLLAAVPVLVEPALELIREMRSPDSGEGAETAGSLDVADYTDHDERRSRAHTAVRKGSSNQEKEK